MVRRDVDARTKQLDKWQRDRHLCLSQVLALVRNDRDIRLLYPAHELPLSLGDGARAVEKEQAKAALEREHKREGSLSPHSWIRAAPRLDDTLESRPGQTRIRQLTPDGRLNACQDVRPRTDLLLMSPAVDALYEARPMPHEAGAWRVERPRH